MSNPPRAQSHGQLQREQPNVQMAPFVLYLRIRGMSWIPLLARLRARECPALEFAFSLEPVVQITAWLFAAFEIDRVGATSDFFVTRGVPY